VPYVFRVNDLSEHPDYGTKIVDLGLIPGGFTYRPYLLADNIRMNVYDRYGNELAGLPVMDGVNTGADIGVYVNLGAGAAPACLEAVIGAFSQFGTRIVFAGEAESFTMLISYALIGQLHGMTCGAVGGAAYEGLLGEPVRGLVTPRMYITGEVFVGLLIIAGIVASNILYFTTKKPKTKKGRSG
jgi:hypothetical protein